jgi:hypothetical protein
MRNRHPAVKSFPDGRELAGTICEFARHHDPEIKYEGMHTALDVLTACWSLNKIPHDFHYEIMKYTYDGVYIKRVEGKGHRTTAEQTKEIINRRVQPLNYSNKDITGSVINIKTKEVQDQLKTITAKLVKLWETNLEGTKVEKFNQLSERATGLLLFDKLSKMVDTGITKELWQIIDRGELIRTIGNLKLLDIRQPVKSEDFNDAGDARTVMMFLLDQSEGSNAEKIRQIGYRIDGLYSLERIDELKNVFKRIDDLIDFDDLFWWVGLFATVGDRVWDYLM